MKVLLEKRSSEIWTGVVADRTDEKIAGAIARKNTRHMRGMRTYQCLCTSRTIVSFGSRLSMFWLLWYGEKCDSGEKNGDGNE